MLWMLLPDEALPLLIVGIGLALILGLVSRSAAFGLVGLMLLFALLGPIVEGVMGGMPPWISLVILAVVILVLLKGMARLVLGGRAADHMVGILAADLVRLAVRLMMLPFRAIYWAVRTVGIGGLR